MCLFDKSLITKILLLVKLMRFLILPSFLQPEISRHLLVNQSRRAMEIDVMITICEPLNMELLRADLPHSQSVDQDGRVLEMHIVVSSSVLDEEAPTYVLETSRLADRSGVVTCFIGGEQLHVSLGIHGVVESPVRDRSCQDGEGESVAVEFEDFSGEVATV